MDASQQVTLLWKRVQYAMRKGDSVMVSRLMQHVPPLQQHVDTYIPAGLLHLKKYLLAQYN
eukprot:gene35951-20867_t